jgi:hypothetical protein
MKSGGTHLAHKHEQAINLETGAIVGLTLHGGAAGDTKTIEKTLTTADANLAEVRQEGSQTGYKRCAGLVDRSLRAGCASRWRVSVSGSRAAPGAPRTGLLARRCLRRRGRRWNRTSSSSDSMKIARRFRPSAC